LESYYSFFSGNIFYVLESDIHKINVVFATLLETSPYVFLYLVSLSIFSKVLITYFPIIFPDVISLLSQYFLLCIYIMCNNNIL